MVGFCMKILGSDPEIDAAIFIITQIDISRTLDHEWSRLKVAQVALQWRKATDSLAYVQNYLYWQKLFENNEFL